LGRKHEPYSESTNSPRQKEVRQVKSKVKSLLIILFDIKGIDHKEFILASQSVSSSYDVMFHGDCMEMTVES
jgi:hypothetical protein